MSARDELAALIWDEDACDWRRGPNEAADAILAAGYRKIFDGDCGLSNVKDPTEREAAEAWIRWANLAMDDEIGAIGAMKQMLAEFGYRRPRTITTPEELDALPIYSVVLAEGVAYQHYGHWEPGGDDIRWSAEGHWWVTSQVDLPASVLYEPGHQS